MEKSSFGLTRNFRSASTMFGVLKSNFLILIVSILCILMAMSSSSLAANAQQTATTTPTPNGPLTKADWDNEALKLASQADQQLDQKSINSALKSGLDSLAHYQDGIYHPESGSVLASSVALAPVAPLILTQGDGEALVQAEWNADGTRLLTLGQQGTSVWVWNAITGKHELTLTHDDSTWIFKAEWDPSGKRIVTSGEDSTVRVWDSVTGQELLIISVQGTDAKVQWSPSGKQISIFDAVSTLQIVDSSSGKVLLTSEQAGIGATARVHWNRAESQVMSANGDGVQVWDTASGTRRLSL